MYKFFVYSLVFLVSETLISQDSLLISIIKKNTYPINFSEYAFEGEGVNFLKEIAAEHHYILLGENHGIADNSVFTAAIVKHLKPYGFN